jgi:hypothetical protein
MGGTSNITSLNDAGAELTSSSGRGLVQDHEQLWYELHVYHLLSIFTFQEDIVCPLTDQHNYDLP